MDTFQKYDNTAGFFIGNEVINDGSMSGVALYIRAAIKDMKAYRAQKGYRAIPIGYSHGTLSLVRNTSTSSADLSVTADVQSVGQNLEEYFACGDTSSMLEFYGLNSYRWCGDSSFQTSGYVSILNQTANYPIPIFMSETGCIVPEPRLFTDQNAILGPDMNDVWSGAIIYEWIQEENHYGLITYGGGNTNDMDYDVPAGGFSRSGTPTPITPDFSNLLSVWATNNPTGSVVAAAYTPTLSPLACPTYQAGSWQVDPSAVLPTIGGVAAAAPAASTAAPVSTARASVAAVATTTSTLPIVPVIAPVPAPSSSSPVTASVPASSPAAVSSSAAVAPVPVVAASSTSALVSSAVTVVQSTTTSLILASSNQSSTGAASSSVVVVVAGSSTHTTTAAGASAAATTASAAAAAATSTHAAGALSGKDLTGGASLGLLGLLLGAGFWL